MKIQPNSPAASETPSNQSDQGTQTPAAPRAKRRSSGVAPLGFNEREFEAQFERQWARQAQNWGNGSVHHHYYHSAPRPVPVAEKGGQSRTPSQSPPKPLPAKKAEPAPKPAVSSNGNATYNAAMGMFVNDSAYSEQLGYDLIDQLFGKSKKK